VWLVVGDADFRALLLTIGEEAGIPVAAIEPETVATLLTRGERPEAMLVSRGLMPKALDPAHVVGIARLAIASADGVADDADGAVPGVMLQLPASLDDVERTLRWLAADGGQALPSFSNDSSSRLD
jgi:hypothetical protein